jgi:hypothetical protein
MARWQNYLDQSSIQGVYQKATTKDAELARPTVVDPMVTERISYINSRAPWLSPNTQVALAKSYASDQAIDKVAGYSSRSLVDNPQQAYTQLNSVPRSYWTTPAAIQARVNVGQGKKDQDVGLLDSLYGGFKQVSRVATAISMGLGELANNAASLEFEQLGVLNNVMNPFYGFSKDAENKNQNIKNALNSLSLWQLLTDWENQGEGFFISEEQMSRQSEAARAYRGTLGGSAFTIGRGAAATAFDPGSKWYNAISGTIDFGVALALPDPNKYIVKGIKGGAYAARAAQGLKTADSFVDAYKSAKGIVPLVSQADAGDFVNAIKSEAGLSKSLTGMSLDVNKWNNFMDNHPIARRAVKDLIDTTNPEDVLKKFRGRITIEESVALSKAKTAEQVKEVLVNQYALGKNTLSTDIYDIHPNVFHNPAQWAVQRTPLKRSRLLMHLPEREIVINGNDQQRSASVLNMIKSIENSGGTPEDVRKFSAQAFDRFKATSSADDQRDAYKVYESAVRIILERNGVKKEVSNLIFERPRYDMQKLRSYMTNRMGIETDNGMMKTYAAQLRKHFPDTVYNDMLEKVAETGYEGYGFTRPMQLSELFDRVQTLPDPREIRRLTGNPLFMEALNAVGITAKPTKYLTSKVRRMEVIEYTDPERAVQIKDEILQLTKKNRNNVDNIKLGGLRDELESMTQQVQRLRYTGEANMGIAFMDTLQNSIWKPLQLATIGYVMRNSIDAQVRMAFGGGSGLLNHPVEYISLLIGETKSSSRLMKMAKNAGFDTFEKSILGDELTAKAADLYNNLRQEHAELLNLDARKQGLGANNFGGHLHRTNQWRVVTKQDGIENYTRGVINQIRLSNSDELQRIAARGRVLGLNDEEIMQELLSTAKNRKNLDNIDGIYKRGVPFVDRMGNEAFGPARSIKGLAPKDLDEWLTNVHLKPVVVDSVDNLAGGYNEMNFMIAFDKVPLYDNAFEANVGTLLPKFAGEDLKAGSFVKNADGEEGVITRLLDDGTATVVPVAAGSASKGYNGHKMARSFIRRAQVFDGVEGSKGLPQGAAMEIIYASNKEKTSWFNDVQEGLDKKADLLFNELIGKRWVKTTERSPVFRKFYYDTISEQIGRLSKKEADDLIAKLKVNAQKAGMGDDIGKYIGSKDAAQRLLNVKGTGTVTASQLDDYARVVALEKTKGLLYDASEKNNLEDTLRIIAPFISAWKNVLGTYAGLMLEDPTVATRFGRYSNMMMHSDPDKDGRGFWYKDPQTGETYFKFPAIMGLNLPAFLLDKVSGVNPFFEAPVSQLSQGMSWLPGLGPIAQLPATFLLRNKPDNDWMVKALLPYGKVPANESLTSLSPVPGSVSKVAGVIKSYVTNSEDQMGTSFSNAYIEVLRARYATGDYDINKEEDLKRLKSDTKRDAQNITLLRAAQQFVGPTSPQVGLTVKVRGVDVYVDQMAKVFEKMQEENYDTATQRFLKVFGEEMALYVGSKSRSVVPGLEASTEFGEWEFNNKDLLEGKYSEVAAYLAPSGSELNFDVWKRQLGEGKRVKLSDDELIQQAQNRIGSAKYREARKMFGQFPNDTQRARLDSYRASLNEQYPGFPRYASFEVGKFPNQLAALEDLVLESKVQDNPIIPILKDYLANRKIYLAAAGGKSFESKKATPARMHMYNYGNQLAAQNPQFARIWERLLIQEVED